MGHQRGEVCSAKTNINAGCENIENRNQIEGGEGGPKVIPVVLYHKASL